MHTPRTAHTARRHWTRTPKAWIAGACASVILGGMGAVALSDPRIPTLSLIHI